MFSTASGMLVHLSESLVKSRFAQGVHRITSPISKLHNTTYEDFILRIKDCQRCSLATRREWPPVSPAGGLNSRIAIVGRCPSYTEGIEGVPFPNKTYRHSLLTEYMKLMGIPKDDVWLTNAVLCDSGHRRPSLAEVDVCRWWKLQELSLLPRLEVVFLCGISAVRALTALPFTHISEVVGFTYETDIEIGGTNRPVWLIPSLHPICLGWSQLELGRRVSVALAACVRDALHRRLSSRAGQHLTALKGEIERDSSEKLQFSENSTQVPENRDDTLQLSASKTLLRERIGVYSVNNNNIKR